MNTRETTELENFIFDLSVAEEEQAGIKGGPVVLQDCLVSSYQSGGHDGSKATPKLILVCATGQH